MKVLVVDDIKFNCLSLQKMLERLNHRVLVAYNGADALQLIRENPDIGMVITDLLMENMDGKELLAETQKLSVFSGAESMNPPPFVLMTAGSNIGSKEELDQLGFKGVLEKPLNIEMVAKTISQLTSIQTNEKALHLVIADVQGTTFQWFQSMFEDSPHKIIRANNAKQVLDRYDAGDAISIIISETDLDDMAGTTLFKRLKSKQFDKMGDGKAVEMLPFLLITDGLSAEQLKEIKDAGIKDMMSKPLDLAVIADKLSKLSNGADYKKATNKIPDEILVVDDVGFNLVILERTFKELGYAVKRASSAYEAIEAIQQPHRIKAVFSDLVMPGLDGVDMLVHLKAQLGKNIPPFVLITASSDEVRIGDATRTGYKKVLRKPLQLKEVHRVLAEILAPPAPPGPDAKKSAPSEPLATAP